MGSMVPPLGTLVVICESEFTLNVAVSPTRTPRYPERWVREHRKQEKEGKHCRSTVVGFPA